MSHTPDIATAESTEAPTSSGDLTSATPRWATLLSEIFAPWVCAALLPPIVGAASANPWWKGLLLGLMASALSAGIPYLMILRGVRRGRLTDRHVSQRSDRPKLLALVVTLVLASLVLTILLGAPEALVSLIVTMISCAAIGMIVSLWWKLSLHTVVLSASIVVLTIAVSTWVLVLTVALIALAFARVRLEAHTRAQVTVGAVLGAAVALLIASV